MVIPRRFAPWTGWSGFFRSRVTRPRLPTVRLTGGLRTTVHRVFWSASVRCRYQAISMQTSASGRRRSGPRAFPDCTSQRWRGWT